MRALRIIWKRTHIKPCSAGPAGSHSAVAAAVAAVAASVGVAAFAVVAALVVAAAFAAVAALVPLHARRLHATRQFYWAYSQLRCHSEK